MTMRLLAVVLILVPSAIGATPASQPAVEPYDRLFVSGHGWHVTADVTATGYAGDKPTTSRPAFDCDVRRVVTVGAARVAEVVCDGDGARTAFAGFYVRTERGLWHRAALPTEADVEALDPDRVLVPAGSQLVTRTAGHHTFSYELCVTRARIDTEHEARVRWCFAGDDLVSVETLEGDDVGRRATYVLAPG